MCVVHQIGHPRSSLYDLDAVESLGSLGIFSSLDRWIILARFVLWNMNIPTDYDTKSIVNLKAKTTNPDLNCYTPQKLTWNLEMMVSNRNLLFQGSIFRFHVCFRGCKYIPHAFIDSHVLCLFRTSPSHDSTGTLALKTNDWTLQKMMVCRWWQLKYFSFSSRKLGKMNPF